MVPSGDSYEVYEKQPMKPTEADFFRILAFEDTHYRDLKRLHHLSFCGNKDLSFWIRNTTTAGASDSEEYTQCKEIVTSIKKFHSISKTPGRLSSIESNINMQKNVNPKVFRLV